MRQVTSSGVSAERVDNPQHLKGSYQNVRNASTELRIHQVDDRSLLDIQGTREPHTRMNLNANPWTGAHNMKHGVAVSSQFNPAADTAVCRQLIS